MCDQQASWPVKEAAAWLLEVGYGSDFAFHESGPAPRRPMLPPREILEEMVRQASNDPEWVTQEGDEAGCFRSAADREAEAYFVLSSELGDWRAAA